MARHGQIDVRYIESFPKLPQPFRVRDWKETARDYDALVFDLEAKGRYLPLVRLSTISEPTRGGYAGEIFAIPSYVGRPLSAYGEALTCLGAVLGGSLIGVDKSKDRGKDWLRMCEAYYTVIGGHGLVLNGVNQAEASGSFWYDIFPSCLYFHIGSLYPGIDSLERQMRAVADSWLEALPVLHRNWEHTGFSFSAMHAVDSGRWVEPDAAIGIAYLEYIAFLKWGDPRYLGAAWQCMEQMAEYPGNPYYEILGSYGPCLAARLNAEQGGSLPIDRFLGHVFHFTSSARPGWGIIRERWGDYDAYGLAGSTTDSAGYAFSMNTYTTAGVVAPLARYAPQYSRALARWLLHVASSSGLFFPDFLPSSMQSEHEWPAGEGITCVSYEGTRNKGKTTPYATGDAEHYFNPYGAWGSGFMGALFDRTNVPQILKADMLATDFEHGPAFPTFLYYNPLEGEAAVEIDVGPRAVDLYDAVTKRILVRRAIGRARFTLPADEAALLVLTPAGGMVSRSGDKMLVDGVVVDYRAGDPSDLAGAEAGYSLPSIEVHASGLVEMPIAHRAYAKPVTVSSSRDPGHGGGAAVDADWGTAWIAGEGEEAQWLAVDLGGVYRVVDIKVRWADDAFAKGYKLQISLYGRDWTDVYETSEGDGGLDDIAFLQPVTGRHVRVYCTRKGGGSAYSIIEIEVNGEPQ